jgi:hypothetical protein
MALCMNKLMWAGRWGWGMLRWGCTSCVTIELLTLTCVPDGPLVYISVILHHIMYYRWQHSKGKHCVCDPMPLTITSPYVNSNTCTRTMGNPMPGSTLTLWQIRLYPMTESTFTLWQSRLYPVEFIPHSETNLASALKYGKRDDGSVHFIEIFLPENFI